MATVWIELSSTIDILDNSISWVAEFTGRNCDSSVDTSLSLNTLSGKTVGWRTGLCSAGDDFVHAVVHKARSDCVWWDETGGDTLSVITNSGVTLV